MSTLKEQLAAKREENKRIKAVRKYSREHLSKNEALAKVELVQEGVDSEEAPRIWDINKQTYDECLTMFRSPVEALQIAQDPRVLANPAAVQKLNVLMGTLANDMEIAKHNLQSIYDTHKHRNGIANDFDDYYAAMAVGEAYFGWVNSFNPTVNISIDILNVCASALPEEESGRIAEDTQG